MSDEKQLGTDGTPPTPEQTLHLYGKILAFFAE